MFNRWFCFEIVQFSEFSTQSNANFLDIILVNNNSSRVHLPQGPRKFRKFVIIYFRLLKHGSCFSCARS